MFSESPNIKALAFGKHHILSVNNLVFVRNRSRPRNQNYSVPEKFKILPRRTISLRKIFSSTIIRQKILPVTFQFPKFADVECQNVIFEDLHADHL